VEDSAGRVWEYGYDAEGRLVEAGMRGVTLDAGGSTGDVVERYTWTDSSAATVPAGVPVLEGVEDGVEPARQVLGVEYDEAGRVVKVRHGEVEHTIEYPSERVARVKAAVVVPEIGGREEEVEWDELGRIVRRTVGGEGGATERYRYAEGSSDPLPVAVDLATEGDEEIRQGWGFESSRGYPRRMAFNLMWRTRRPDSEGDETVPVVEERTSYEYWGETDLVKKVSLPGGREWEFERDGMGSVVAVKDPEGRRTEIERDELGREVSRKPGGKDEYATRYEYDDAVKGTGEVSRVTPPSGNLVEGASGGVATEIVHDAYGNVVEVREPSSGAGEAVTHVRRNKLGWELERWVDGSEGGDEAPVGAAEHVKRWYDAGGRVTKEVRGSDALHVTVRWETKESGLVSVVHVQGTTLGIPGVEVGPEWLTIRYGYGPDGGAPGVVSDPDPSDGLVRQVYHEETGRAIAVEYDGRERVRARKVWDGEKWLTTRYEYGRSDDRVTVETDPAGHRWGYRYDRLGRRVGVEDPLGRERFVRYDEAGRVETSGVKDEAGEEWSWRGLEYNDADQVVRETVRSRRPTGGAVDRVTRYEYEGERGLLERIERPGGLVLEVDHDAAGRVSEERIKDGASLVASIVTRYWPSGREGERIERPADPGEGSPEEYRSERGYDRVGRVVEEERPGGHRSVMGYDALGRLSWRQDPGEGGSLLTRVWRSALGMVEKVEATGRSVRVRRYDEDGMLEEDAEEGGAEFRAEYDGAGRVVRQELPGGVWRELGWNDDGTLASERLSDGTEVTHVYDEAGRLVGRLVEPGEGGHDLWSLEEGYAYDALDRVVEAWNDRGVRVRRQWRSTGELLEETLEVEGVGSFRVGAGYDDAGRLTELEYPDGTVVEMGRDALGRMTAMEVGGEQLWSGSYHGMLVGETVQGLLRLSRRHSAEGMPSEVRGVVGSSEHYELRRDYGPTLRYGKEERRTTFGSSSELDRDGGLRVTGWRSEGAGLVELPEGVLGGRAAGERMEREFGNGGYDDLVSRRLTSGGASQAEVFSVERGTHRVGGMTGWEYAYDALGSRKEALSPDTGESVAYEHDWSGRLLEVEGGEGEVALFVYDALGRRVVERRFGVTSYRVGFGDQEVERYVEDVNGEVHGRKREYWGDGVDQLVAYDWDADLDGGLETRLYPIVDEKGTVQAVADDEGTIVESYVYRPDGSFRIFGTDTTAPEVLLARVRPAEESAGRSRQRMEVVFTEAVQLGGGIAEVRDGDGGVVVGSGEWERSADGRRWWAEIDPELEEGESYTLYLSGLEDLAGNRMAVDPPIEAGFVGPGEGEERVLAIGGAGKILAVIDGEDRLVLVSGTPVDEGSVGASSLEVSRYGVTVSGTLEVYDGGGGGGGGDVQGWEGRLLVWRPDDAGEYRPGAYTLSLNLALTDAAGHPIHGPPGLVTYTHQGRSDIIWSAPPETPVLTASAVGNDRYLHGRPYLPELGLYDHRARFYEPATNTFLEPDPLGPVDSPNLYQAFGFDGLNVTDPYGLSLRWYDWFGIVADAVTSTKRDVGKVALGIATVGVSTRMEEAYERGEVRSFGDSVRVAADAVTNTVTLGMRDQYERGANTAEAAWEVSGLAGVERGSRKIGEGIGLGDTELALQGVGEFAGGTGQFAGWVAGATALGKRTVSAASMDELGEAAHVGMREFGIETEALEKGTSITIRSAEAVNATYPTGYEPPYMSGTSVYEYTTASEQVFVRVHGPDNMVGRWIMRPEQIQGLTAEEIASRFSLPEVPQFVSEVHVPAGTKLRSGIANSILGREGGATQYEVPKAAAPKLPSEWFTNTRTIR